MLAVTSGCAVDVDAPDVSATTRAACERFVRVLPDRLDGHARRDVNDPKQGAAWGDPAIVLRCGVSEPAKLKFGPCQEVNGIGWFVPKDQLGSTPRDITLTSIGRSPRLEVQVPADYWPPAGVMADLAGPVKRATEKTSACS